MKKAESGSTVKVHYTGKLDNGAVFDSSKEREPLEFTIGQGQLIKGFDDAVEGMSEGETKTVTIPCNEAYGPHQNELVVKIPREQFPQEIEPKLGLCLSATQPDGNTIDVVVTEIAEGTVTLDANHPLAGKDLTFDIELVKID